MAPARRTLRRSTRNSGAAGNAPPSGSTAAGRGGVPDVYQDMLAEVEAGQSSEAPERQIKRRRPLKRARIERRPGAGVASLDTKAGEEEEEEEEEEDVQFEDVVIPQPTVQTLLRDSDDEDDDEDDDDDEIQFEDVDFSFPDLNAEPADEPPKTIEVTRPVAPPTAPRRPAERRKPLSRAEKDRRVEIHKTHLLCLLSHVSRRNGWCNDDVVQKRLETLLTEKMVNYLNPSPKLSQFGRTESLKNGLQQASTKFKQFFQVTERGCRRALWAESEEHLQNYQLPDNSESPMEKSDFRDAAKSLSGSRDVGAQLFCALLRSAGVEARLVCSLQALSFRAGGPLMGKTPKSRAKLSIEEQYARMTKYDSVFDTPKSRNSSRRRLGHANATAYEVPVVSQPRGGPAPSATPKKIRESQFPVYWVEVLDEAHQKWQPVDPLVTESQWKPRVLEPPASDRDNCMTYVVGFEADGTATDVTRRYAKAYNAKTRKMRIESISEDGDKWWRKSLRAYSRGHATDLDQIESTELNATEAREPMPRNVADFKGHPVYALERHLRRHEVLIPDASPSGTVGAGSRGLLEKIYRRRDVRMARTREKWYRMGREVLDDEVPVKFLIKMVKKKVTDVFGDEEELEDVDTETPGTPIYTIDQTKLYKPPPVVDGIIPKNRFGNIDVYVPSMIPDGSAYITDDMGRQAAFTLGIDYAPALTGFHFKGRQGTAVLHGVVVAAEYEEAMWEVIEGFKYLELEMEQERRTREVLKMWRRLLMNLRVRQRIWAGVDSDEEGNEPAPMLPPLEDMDQDEDDEDDEYEGGGFMVEDDNIHQPPKNVHNTGGGFMVEDTKDEHQDKDGDHPVADFVAEDDHNAQQDETGNHAEGGFIIGDSSNNNPRRDKDSDNAGGGFTVEEAKDDPQDKDVDDNGGGFIVEEDDEEEGAREEEDEEEDDEGEEEEEDNDSDDNGGGFIVEDDDYAGGFFAE